MSRIRRQAKQSLKLFREMLQQDRLYVWMLIASVLLWMAAVLLLVWRIVPLSAQKPYLPLHYNVYFGVDRFGPWVQVFVLPGLGLFFLLVSLVMQSHFYQREKMLARFFSLSTVFIEATFFVATILIVLLNI